MASFTDESADRILDLTHGRVRVRMDGPGAAPPLLLIHGSPCSLEWFDQLATLMCDSFLVVRVDLREPGRDGHRSARPPW
ncbi:alpha/beta fold hydrolase [Nocardia sp. NPDC060220]|uniref:alpha/beta fold hydrolase n=1 Tax=Nocardia sp. NPDC060220 TaxID=3347076 RepID=UPI0036586DAA